MAKIGTDLNSFILEEERKHPDATGSLTMALMAIEAAAKKIASHVRRAGLADILGKAGTTNVQEEEVQKLDVISNNIMIEHLSACGEFFALASEELDEAIFPEEGKNGKYIIAFDPLDGSSTMLVYSTGSGVNGFTLDPSVGMFLLSHPDIKLPEKGKIYSLNESNYKKWDEPLRKYVDHLKDKGYTARYIGSMVADVHRTLIKGGMFGYPADKKNVNGKLRLLYEASPMAFLIEQAGGKSSTGKGSILDIKPEKLHQRVPVFLGSKYEMDLLEKYMNE